MKTKFNDLVGVHFHCFHPQRLWFGEQPLGTASAGYVSGYVSSCLRLTRKYGAEAARGEQPGQLLLLCVS